MFLSFCIRLARSNCRCGFPCRVLDRAGCMASMALLISDLMTSSVVSRRPVAAIARSATRRKSQALLQWATRANTAPYSCAARSRRRSLHKRSCNLLCTTDRMCCPRCLCSNICATLMSCDMNLSTRFWCAVLQVARIAEAISMCLLMKHG